MTEVTLLRVLLIISYFYQGPNEEPVVFPVWFWIYAILLELDWLNVHYMWVSSIKDEFNKRFNMNGAIVSTQAAQDQSIKK